MTHPHCCANHASHSPQSCPEIKALLIAPDTDALPIDIPAIRARIAELRERGANVTASIMRDELLSQIECWIDPAGIAYTRELQTIQGKAAVALALERVEFAPF